MLVKVSTKKNFVVDARARPHGISLGVGIAYSASVPVVVFRTPIRFLLVSVKTIEDPRRTKCAGERVGSCHCVRIELLGFKKAM